METFRLVTKPERWEIGVRQFFKPINNIVCYIQCLTIAFILDLQENIKVLGVVPPMSCKLIQVCVSCRFPVGSYALVVFVS